MKFFKSLTKSLIYRMYSFLVTWIVVFVITGNIKSTTIITAIMEIVKTINYLIFETIWEKIKNER